MSSPTTIPRADSYRYAPTTKPNNTVSQVFPVLLSQQAAQGGVNTSTPPAQQGLLKDKLQLVRVDSPENKHARYTIKRLPDKLPFDKVACIHIVVGLCIPPLLMVVLPVYIILTQGLYVFVRAIQLLAHKIEGVVLV